MPGFLRFRLHFKSFSDRGDFRFGRQRARILLSRFLVRCAGIETPIGFLHEFCGQRSCRRSKSTPWCRFDLSQSRSPSKRIIDRLHLLPGLHCTINRDIATNASIGDSVLARQFSCLTYTSFSVRCTLTCVFWEPMLRVDLAAIQI